MIHPFASERLSQIFRVSKRNLNLISTNEGITIEYKQSFGWASLSDYLKAMASYANRDGGYLIFGIKDKPHELMGLQGDALKRFNSIDNMEWTTNIREYFSPEIRWEKCLFDFSGKQFGIIYTFALDNKPVICKKDSGELRKAAIYYRYNSQNSEIDYPELAALIEAEKQKIHNQWMRTVKQIGDVGISKTALLDLKSGKMTGPNTTLFIDENLLEVIKFVQEGTFVETGGDPALVVKGQVQTVVGAQRIVVEKEKSRAINTEDIIRCFITKCEVDSPEEYIKQICYQSSGNLPVYYYMNQVEINTTKAIELIKGIPINSQQKKVLLNRIQNKTQNYLEISTQNTASAVKKKSYLKNILNDTIEFPTDVDSVRCCLIAIRGLKPSDVVSREASVLNLLYRMFTEYFYDPTYDAVKQEMRYAICWIDEALYMPVESELK